MSYTLRWLVEQAPQNCRQIRPGVWVPARPLEGPWIWRLRDAWEVLRGRADAFTWPENDAPPQGETK